MRSRVLFLCLLLLSFSMACSNKGPDATSNTAANGVQPPASTSSSVNAPVPPPGTAAQTAPAPAPIVIPAGTAITVRTQTALSSGTNQSGDSFGATLADPITVDGKVIAKAGDQAQGTVAEAVKKGKIKGAATLRLELTSLTISGTSYPITTSMAGFAAKGKGKRTAIASGGGAALGAIIGGIAGGGKGAAIGLLAGGGAGFAGGTLTGNKQIELPAETALTFKLKEPVTLK